MWYRNENGSLNKPEAVDTTSSRIYVYVRRGFEQIPESGEGDYVVPAHWQWMEQKVKKEDWEIYQTVTDHSGALDDVYAALTELAEIIAGEG